MIEYLCLYIIIVIIMLIVSEILGYLWHRYAVHGNMFSLFPILETHRIHHLGNRWEKDKGDDDYIWVLLILCVFVLLCLLLIYILVKARVLQSHTIKNIILIVILTIVFTFWINWYIHSVIHTDDHWLQQYQIIKDLTTIHRIHHSDPKSNFSVLV